MGQAFVWVISLISVWCLHQLRKLRTWQETPLAKQRECFVDLGSNLVTTPLVMSWLRFSLSQHSGDGCSRNWRCLVLRVFLCRWQQVEHSSKGKWNQVMPLELLHGVGCKQATFWGYPLCEGKKSSLHWVPFLWYYETCFPMICFIAISSLSLLQPQASTYYR